MESESIRCRAVGAVILLLVVSATLASFEVPKKAVAAPTVVDHANGNKTVSWDFSNPADYTTQNITLAGGAELSQTNGQIVHDTDTDFIDNNLTWDSANLTISSGSIASKQFRKDKIENGTFDDSSPWNFLDSPDNNVTSQWNSTIMAGTFSHNRAATLPTSFDEMDSGVGTWVAVARGPNPPHTASLFNDAAVYVEPPASFRMDIQFKTQITGSMSAQRTGSFDWSSYDVLSMWLNTTYPGPQVLNCYVNLLSLSGEWNSSWVWVTQGWKQYFFDVSSFSSRASITRIEIRFTNVTSRTESVWIDDLTLYPFDRISQVAQIYQDVVKENFTDTTPGTVLLSFRYRADTALNLYANLAVSINSTLLTVPPINVTAGSGWTTSAFDISTTMRAKGVYNVTFSLSVYLRTQLASFISVHIDNVSLTVPDYRGGVYVSKPLDIGSGAFFDQVTWLVSVRPGTRADLEIRGGWSSNPLDGSWTPWRLHSSSPDFLLDNSTGRFLQYRVTLVVANASSSTSFDRVAFTFYMYCSSGRVETFDYVPPEQLLGWRLFEAVRTTRPGASATYAASDDSGGSWTPATSGTSLSSLAGLRIRLRADIATANTTISLKMLFLNITYEFIGPLASITVSPSSWSGTADEGVQFSATGKDSYGHPVALSPTWTDDDLFGFVNSTGFYTAGKVGDWHVCATDGGKTDCANVTVAVGQLRILVSPPSVTVAAGGLQDFTATGEDSDGNPIPLTATEWLTNVGAFERVSVGSAIFRAQGTAKTGYVEAREGAVSGQSSVTVQASTTILIQGTVPDILKQEDSPPWDLNLTPFLPAGPNANDLMWYFDGKDDSLYSVFGERRFGQHILTFTPVKDANGNSNVTLWLENRTGARASQSFWIRITPVNDAPVFYDVPDLSLKFNLPYLFDYSPYIQDIDTPRSALILTTNDQAHARVQGLTVNYSYDAAYRGQTVLVRLRISDGDKASETIQVLKIGDHAPPNIIKDLPDLTMQEDEVLNDAFTEPLSAFFTDPDGEELSFSYEGSHFTVNFWLTVPDEIHVRIIPERDWFGTGLLTIRAKDPPGAEVAQTVIVYVAPVDDAPALLWHDDVTVKYDVPYELDLTDYVSDVDTPMSGLTLSTNRTDLVSVDRFSLSLLLPRYLLGTLSSVPLSLILYDGQLMTWSNITVYVADNWPPEPKAGTSLPDVTFNEDERANAVFSLNDYFTDPDLGPQMLTYTIISSKVTGTVDPVDRTASFYAPPNWNGQEVVHVKAYDGAAYVMGRLTVKVLPVNDAPSILPIPERNLGPGNTAAIDLRNYVYDIDNNVTELLFSTNSAHASAVGYMLLLDYRGGSPSETVTVTVSDGLLQNYTSLRVNVAPVTPPDGGEEDSGLTGILWPWSLLVVLVIVAIIGFVMYNRMLNAKFAVEDVFMLGKDGRLIMHTTRHQRADRDEDSLAGMLSAIMAFIRESYDDADQEDFRSFTFGDRQVHVQRDTQFYFVAIYAGEPPSTAQDSIAAITRDVEKGYGHVLADWRGDANEVRELRAFTDAFVARRKYRRGDWKRFASKRK